MKGLITVLLEALVVAIVVVLFYYIVRMVSSKFGYDDELVNVAIAGGLVHIVFEYIGLNKRYVDNYYK